MSIANPYVKFGLHRGGNGEIVLISAIFQTSNTLGGHSHSNYGKSWYTNSYDGTSRPFKEIPTYPWIKGRGLFHGETCKLTSRGCLYGQHRIRHDTKVNIAKNLWNEFHSGEYLSIRDFARCNNKKFKYVTDMLHLIPAFNRAFIPRSHNNGSNRKWVDVYE